MIYFDNTLLTKLQRVTLAASSVGASAGTEIIDGTDYAKICKNILITITADSSMLMAFPYNPAAGFPNPIISRILEYSDNQMSTMDWRYSHHFDIEGTLQIKLSTDKKLYGWHTVSAATWGDTLRLNVIVNKLGD